MMENSSSWNACTVRPGAAAGRFSLLLVLSDSRDPCDPTTEVLAEEVCEDSGLKQGMRVLRRKRLRAHASPSSRQDGFDALCCE